MDSLYWNTDTLMGFGMIIVAIVSAIIILFFYKKNKKLKKLFPDDFEITGERQQAIDYMENTNQSILITGRAGTGKSKLLDYFRKITKKKIIVLAPTGVAALNIKGQTIHSFFGFGIDITPNRIHGVENQSIYKNIDLLVIDEISMVRADLLDCIDIFLRLNGPNSSLPFGGIQMIFIGDLYQLPPILKNEDRDWFNRYYDGTYFFHAKVFEKHFNLKCVELTKNYRQLDKHFTDILDAIRTGNHTNDNLNIINQKYNYNYDDTKNDEAIHLKTTNKMASDFNRIKLSQIQKRSYCFEAEITGDWREGEDGPEKFPADNKLYLKVGAQIMFLNNDPQSHWVNGDVGKVLGIEDSGNGDTLIQVSLNSRIEYVGKNKWDKIRFSYNEDIKDLESEVVGSFIQYPIRLAWAVTIHKAQGKTFDKVVIDLGRGAFSSGQTYVALSRCRTLEGITLKQRIRDGDVIVENKIDEFINSIQ